MLALLYSHSQIPGACLQKCAAQVRYMPMGRGWPSFPSERGQVFLEGWGQLSRHCNVEPGAGPAIPGLAKGRTGLAQHGPNDPCANTGHRHHHRLELQ